MTTEECREALEGAVKADLREVEGEGFQLWIARGDILSGSMAFYGWVDEDDVDDVQDLVSDFNEVGE